MSKDKLLKVVRLGDPALRVTAEPVPEHLFGSNQLNQLVESMIETMMAEKGVGLAAPQVGEALRLFVYWLPGDHGQPALPPTVLINPEVRTVGSGVEEGWEGCLSIPGLRGLVQRNERVKVKARNLDGEHISLTADSFHARVIQHESDHLDGTVFLDRMDSMESLSFEEEWQRYLIDIDEVDEATEAA
jgi:peptide deformylase